MTAHQQQTGVGQGFACPGCLQRTSIVGSRIRMGRVRVCPGCFVTGAVAPPPVVRPPAVVTICPGFDGLDRRFQVADGEAPRLFSGLRVGDYLDPAGSCAARAAT